MRSAVGVILCVVIAFFSGCTTGKFVVSDSADLAKYQYASIADVMNYSGAAALMDIEVKVYDALSKTRLKMIGDRVIGELTLEQKEKNENKESCCT